MKALPCRRRLRKKLLALWLALTLHSGSPAPVFAGQITTLEIIDETIAPATLASCVHWALIGLCLWLDCGPTGCTIRTSLLIGHYNPDLVMSGYHRVGENPWLEMAALYGPTQKAAGQALLGSFGVFIGEGSRPNEKFHRSHEDLLFKEADAIGHPLPAAAFLAALVAAGVGTQLCPSETVPFTPYLLSTLDLIAWRFALPETIYPQALIPGLREIGHWPLNTWQALYPRHGFTIQSEDPKAGAVVSQRAGDIVTREAQPHVYLPTSATRPATPGLKVFWPGPLYETDRRTGTFQMLVPLKPRRCEVFGQNDLAWSWAAEAGEGPKVDEAGDYAFTLWRPYRCCRVRGQVLLQVVQWREWPP